MSEIEWIRASEAKKLLVKHSSRLPRLSNLGYIEYDCNIKRYNKESVLKAFKPIECNITSREELIEWYKNNILNNLGRLDSTKFQSDSNFYFRYSNFINKIEDFIPDNIETFEEKYYCLINNINKKPLCKECCKVEVNYHSSNKSYSLFCSTRCSTLNKETYLKRIKSFNNRTILQQELTKIKILISINNRTQEQKNKSNIKRLNTLSNKTDKEKEETRLKRLNTLSNKSEKEKKEIRIKIRKSCINNIDKNGLNSYERQIQKARRTRFNDIDKDGLNSYQRASIIGQETKAINGTLLLKRYKN